MKKLTKEQIQLIKELYSYSDRYEISVQFWPDQVAVYIAKDGVNLKDFGGDFLFALEKSNQYLARITNTSNTALESLGEEEECKHEDLEKFTEYGMTNYQCKNCKEII